MYIFLDDYRYPKDVTWVNLPLYNWTILRSYNEFISWIKNNGVPKFVSFDHDLGDEAMKEAVRNNFTEFNYNNIKEKTGLDCARFLLDFCVKTGKIFPEYVVHSINPVGKKNIDSLIQSYKFNHTK